MVNILTSKISVALLLQAVALASSLNCDFSNYLNRTHITPHMSSTWMYAKSFHDFQARDIRGEVVHLDEYKNQPFVIVNVASKSHFTPEYYKHFTDLKHNLGHKKFTILAFPSNTFGYEPDDPQTICDFNKGQNVDLVLFEKVDVAGISVHPVWKYLKQKKKELTENEDIPSDYNVFISDYLGRIIQYLSPPLDYKKLEKRLLDAFPHK